MKILWGICGSFCNHAAVFEQLEAMTHQYPDITMILSQNVTEMDTRFGNAAERKDALEKLTGHPVMTTLQEAERTGPIDHFDVMIIAPITATELAKLNHGIYDTPIALAAKAMLRNDRPLILGIASNDFLGISGQNLMQLKQHRHVFFVPFGQDDYIHKPDSLVSDWTQIAATMEEALNDHQRQPILLPGKGQA